MIDIKNCFTYAYSAGTFADYYQNVSADAASTNVIDLDTTAGINPVGPGKGPYLIVKSVLAASGVGTIEFRLVSSTSTTMSGSTVVAMWRFANTIMTAGKLLINQQLPIGKYYRYLGMYFNIYTTVCTGILAYLSDTPEAPETVLDNTVAGS